jgi:ubiquinone/menaquinone biosynthesis C-methylase UbiE
MLKPRRLWICFATCVYGATNGFAQLAQQPAEKYIETMNRLERGIEAKIPEVIEKLRLKPGDIVADIGSGSGTFSIPMAKAIAPNGILYAVDIDPKVLEYVAERAKRKASPTCGPCWAWMTIPSCP